MHRGEERPRPATWPAKIARSLHDVIGLTPTRMLVLQGQSTGGCALALFPADRTSVAQHAWPSPLPSEGSSAIGHRSTEHAAAMSEAQGVNVASLYANCIVEHIVDERNAFAAPAGFDHAGHACVGGHDAVPGQVPLPD